MTLPIVANASRRQVLFLDILLSVWVAGWVAVGILIGIDVHHLGRLTTTVSNAGKALQQAGGGLRSLSGVPFIGHTLGGLAGQLSRAGHTAGRNAFAARTSIDQLSYLLAIAVVIIPGTPVFGIYLPFRLGRLFEARAVRSALRHGANRRLLERYLANRALTNLPYHQLEEISHEPWEDVEQGRFTNLAQAELARLGFGPRERARLGTGAG
jgi:hypothetical protein